MAIHPRPARLRAGALFIGLLATAGLAVAACGATGTGVDASPAATSTVDLPKSYKFAPVAISVAVGTTVTWTNDDNFTHTVHVDGQVFKAGDTPPKEIAAQITNPKAWADDKADAESDDETSKGKSTK